MELLRRPRLLAATAAGVLAVAAALVAPAAASAQPTPDPPPPFGPGVGEIVSSDNVTQVANLPFTDPFTGESVGTDIAFDGDLAYVGNYDGFIVYDISDPEAPQRLSQVLCPGAQNDVTVYEDLLFLSTDARFSDDSCSATPATDPALPYWEGIKVFDVSDPANPQYVAAVETRCGSHTHTLVPGETSAYLYVSSYAPNPLLANCQPPHDLISVVEVPLDDPAAAAVVAEPVLFPDGGNPGPGSDTTTGCHDITVFPSQDLAAGACMGDGVLMDISDPLAPRVIEQVRDDVNFAFWHSATFNNEGTKVVFTDELGGGGAATCTAELGPERGANGIYDIVGEGDDRELVFQSYYKLPRLQTGTENCVAHNGSLIPVEGRDIMVQSWYQGGVSIWDFTDSTHPVELGFWERGPISSTELVLGGTWSTYWYNGYLYSSDITEGLDVLRIDDPATDPANDHVYDTLNVQTQPVF